MKRKYLFVVGSIGIISAVIVLALIQVNAVHSGPQASTPTPTYGVDPNATIVLPVMPTAEIPKITDLAPNIPYEDKPSVVVEHADGSRERYLLAPDMLDAFIKNLPKGDKFLGDVPPPSLLMTYEAPESTAIQPTVVDLAPDVPYEDKPSVVVQHPDGTREMFLLAPDDVDDFIHNLPKEDELKLVIPPPAASLTHEAP